MQLWGREAKGRGQEGRGEDGEEDEELDRSKRISDGNEGQRRTAGG